LESQQLDPIAPPNEPAAEPAAVEATPETAAKPAAAAPAPRFDKSSLRGNYPPDAEKRRKVQELELQRERILSDRTPHAHRRAALEAALIDIEEKLAELGWMVHL
jgi:hypothetical protein